MTFFPKAVPTPPKYILLSSFVNRNICSSSTFTIPILTASTNFTVSRETKQRFNGMVVLSEEVRKKN